MAKLRTLWSTTWAGDRRSHPSRTKAYERVAQDAASWKAGVWPNDRQRAITRVWVDERDGHGWQLYERVEHGPAETPATSDHRQETLPL